MLKDSKKFNDSLLKSWNILAADRRKMLSFRDLTYGIKHKDCSHNLDRYCTQTIAKELDPNQEGSNQEGRNKEVQTQSSR